LWLQDCRGTILLNLASVVDALLDRRKLAQAVLATFPECVKKGYFMNAFRPSVFVFTLLLVNLGSVSAQNQITNPGFEDFLTSWTTTPGSAAFSSDFTTRHGGTYSARGDEFSDGSLGALQQEVTSKLVVGQTYVLSGWIKTQNVTGTGGAILALTYVDKSGVAPADGGVTAVGFVQGSQDWTFFSSAPFTLKPLPSDAVALVVSLDFSASHGIAWWDDLALTTPARSGVLSHIAAGGGWTTLITLVNNSSAALPVNVVLHNEDGRPLNLPVTVTQRGAPQTSTTSTVNATINPKESLFISTGTGIPSTSVGWADVNSTGTIGGYAIFRATPQTGLPSEGTVPLQTQFSSTITLPYDNTAGFVMGVALANLATATNNLTATIWDESGNQLGTQNLTIVGNGHTSFVLPTQIPLTAGKRGVVQFQSGGGLAGLGFRFSPVGTFTSVPTL
jgi:hypothetical protein